MSKSFIKFNFLINILICRNEILHMCMFFSLRLIFKHLYIEVETIQNILKIYTLIPHNLLRKKAHCM